MARQLILGLGAGQCGLELLADILGRQPSTRVTLQQPPLLSWDCGQGEPVIGERLARILATTRERFVGDVAAFYLPHVEEAVAFDPAIRMICLKRPEDEIVAGYVNALNRRPRTPVDHWSVCPSPPFERDPIWSRTFPKYEVADREAGIRRYWAEYYEGAAALAQRFPEQFRVVDTERLTTELGVREVLSFFGFPWSDQVAVTGNRLSVEFEPATELPPHPYPNLLDPRRCVILVPFSGFIHQECEQALKELERRGYQVRRVSGYTAIDQGRSQMATDALIEGFEETCWIDADIAFQPDDVDRLRRHNRPIVCGIYPQKGKRALACHVKPDSPSTTFGKGGGLVELLYAGAGFLLIRREVYLAVQEHLDLPVANERFGRPMIPFFIPMIRQIEEGCWYLGEDYAFCERARDCGFEIDADTSVRLWHIGNYRYSWEDAGMDRPHFESFTLSYNDCGQAEAFAVTKPPDPAALAFMARHPWPVEKPHVPPFPVRNGFLPSTRRWLEKSVPPEVQVIVELGSFMGNSTRALADHATGAIIIAIDLWQGCADMTDDSMAQALRTQLYETFLAECWLYRERVVPVRHSTVEGLREVAEAGVQPAVILIGAEHADAAVRRDLTTALDLFPMARIIGHNWDCDEARLAVQNVCSERNLHLEVQGSGWRIAPATQDRS